MVDPKDASVSYEEVIAAAQNILKQGERYTLEKIRRLLGKGTHAKIAECLKQWQISKANKGKITGGSSTRNYKKNNKTSSWRKHNVTYQPIITKKRLEPFTMERLSQEPKIVRSLFLAILYIKELRRLALDQKEGYQNQLTDISKDADKNVVILKSQHRESSNKLIEEYTKLSNNFDSEVKELRKSLLRIP